MIFIQGAPLTIVNAYGGPHFETDIQGMVTLPDCQVSGPTAWSLLKGAGVSASDIGSLTITFEGMSDPVRAELAEDSNLRGITTGATYDPQERHIAVYAGNIAALGLPRQLTSTQEAVSLVDRATRLALGRFAHGIHSREEDQGIQEIMIGSTQKPKDPMYISSPHEKMLRSVLHEHLWPAFFATPSGYTLFFLAMNATIQRRYIQQVGGEANKAETCAAIFEAQSQSSPVITYSATSQGTIII